MRVLPKLKLILKLGSWRRMGFNNFIGRIIILNNAHRRSWLRWIMKNLDSSQKTNPYIAWNPSAAKTSTGGKLWRRTRRQSLRVRRSRVRGKQSRNKCSKIVWIRRVIWVFRIVLQFWQQVNNRVRRRVGSKIAKLIHTCLFCPIFDHSTRVLLIRLPDCRRITVSATSSTNHKSAA